MVVVLLCAALAAPPEPDAFVAARAEMVTAQLAGRDIRDRQVLRAMTVVPRHEFVPSSQRQLAYVDAPLPIGFEQTISQPYVVALMSQLADIQPGERVLEVGTGSGYQAAVLAELGAEVWSIEIVEPLAKQAAATLERLDYTVEVKAGDGYVGWTEHAPFHAILVTSAPPAIPEPLKQQLAVGGHLVAPVGPEGGVQDLLRMTRISLDTWRLETHGAVRFVPMTGEAQKAP